MGRKPSPASPDQIAFDFEETPGASAPVPAATPAPASPAMTACESVEVSPEPSTAPATAAASAPVAVPVQSPAAAPTPAVVLPEPSPLPILKVPPSATPPKAVWPRLDDDLHTRLGGPVGKYLANCDAIRLLHELETVHRDPTDAERVILNQYIGWGGIPQAFNDDQTDPAWCERTRELARLLGEDHASARASVLNAHYTDLFVIDAMWQALRGFGFNGGRVLEPSAGIGLFIGRMPTDLAQASTVTSVELDRISARFTQALYGPYGVKVHALGFEKARLAPNWFDLAISNIPFGTYSVPDDRNVPYANYLIHDYFFCRALEVVRPGGLIAFVTSSGTLDKTDKKVRNYLAGQAELVGAIRLPQGTFKQVANTQVTTDLVFLRKLEAGQVAHQDWINLGPAPPRLLHHNEHLMISKWYVDHPEYVIGQMMHDSNGYAEGRVAVYDGDVRQALAERIARLPKGIYTPPRLVLVRGQAEPRPAVRDLLGFESSTVGTQWIPAPEFVKPGAYCLTTDGRLAVSEGDQLKLIDSTLTETNRRRLRGLLSVRDAARLLLHAQTVHEEDEPLELPRRRLNERYDRFVQAFGPLHAKANRQVFRTDPDFPLLLSLELFDEESGKARKADVFERRTVMLRRKITHCSTPEEALLVSVHERGRVDSAFMASLLSLPEDQILAHLAAQRAIYLDPKTQTWDIADVYLSGNVRRKLIEAELAGDAFAENVRALTDVIPKDLVPGEINARIGSTWIPVRDYAQFLNELLERTDVTVEFCAKVGTWNVRIPDRSTESVAATQTWGTSRMSADDLFLLTLNQEVPTIHDPDPEDPDRSIVNKAETLAIREKQQLLKDHFRSWAFKDPERSARLVRIYNDTFNALRLRQFDGRHLSLPGFSQAYKLHRHQQDGIWRIVSSVNCTLLAHVVGAGKSLTMICGGMELRRLGLARKPCYVVPNHMLEPFAAEFLRAYPHANLLLASKEDLQGTRRRTLLARIATGDWDGIVLTHASFKLIKMSDEATKGFINREIADIDEVLRAYEQRSGRSHRNKIVKELERSKRIWQKRLEDLAEQAKKDPLLTFEELGIDFLFIDEAHFFKNLYRLTKMARIPGLPNSQSGRAFDMYMKTRHVLDLHGGQWGVVFATGTPVANSVAELWTMQRFLQPVTLEQHFVEHFDAWAGNFGDSVTALELAPDGSGYRMHTRFARFVNIPELMTLFREVADIRTAEMVNLPVPRARRHTRAAPNTPALKAYVGELVRRSELIHTGKVHPRYDNMLKVTTDGRKAALDLRMVDPFAADDPHSKVNLCVEQVLEIWKRTADFRGTQLIFCDLSTPKDDGRFNVYHDIRRKLIARGVPREQIAFIHDYETDAEKARLYKAVQAGLIRILLGSTLKMGVGTNVQQRLAASHHLDGPWRPADVEQRDGRIVRQGNINEEVDIYRYVTEGSFDAYIWQTLETKARFIAQIMRADGGLRVAEDVELAALSYAEVKALASGNPLVMEKAGVDAEVLKLSALKSSWEQQQWDNHREVNSLPPVIVHRREEVKQLEADLAARTDTRGSRFNMRVGDTTFTERGPAAERLAQWYGSALFRSEEIRRTNGRQEELAVGDIGGLKLVLLVYGYRETPPRFALRGERLYVGNEIVSPEGIVRVIENTLYGLEGLLEREQTALAATEKRLADIRFELTKPFEGAERLAHLLVRQEEINSQLDLDKGQAGAAEAASEAA